MAGEKGFGRREFLGGAASLLATAGMGRFAFGGGAADAARLRVGVLSDIHIFSRDGRKEGCEGLKMFEKALRYFRGRGVDAVVIAGDMADGSHKNELLAIGETWRKVFGGTAVEKVFVYGNHDAQKGVFFNRGKRKIDTNNDSAAFEIGHGGNRAKFWREAFDEDYAPMYVKDVKGCKFVGVHFGEFDKEGAVAAFLEKNRALLAGDRPFFYVQHYHPKGTCSAPWTWGQDSGASTAALKAFPNAVAFSGHSHTPLTDERTLWRGDFTSVGTASLKYLIPFGGRENSRIFGTDDVMTQQMPYLGCRDGHHGMLMDVYGDRIVLERRDFENDLPVGPDWVVPLPAAAATFEERAAKSSAPEFAPGAKVETRRVSGKNRKGRKVDQIAVEFPTVRGLDGGARAFDYEVKVLAREVDRVKVWATKRVYSPHFYWAKEKDDAKTVCLFAASELPPGNGGLAPERGTTYRFAVSAADSFGNQGRAICSGEIQ